ncbi:MAG: flagellar type III secretion system pore protein FliP [Armatimonadetes bacterium]|nr:flagellar type III secretion system pore protein FliP [Armatimonadota bacterium]
MRRLWPVLGLLAACGGALAQTTTTTTAAPAAAAAAGAGNPASGGGAGGDVLPLPGVSVQLTSPQSRAENYSSLQIMFLLTMIAMAPTMLLMLTSFTRIIIVLGFLRQALGTHQVPPNQVVLGLGLFMTMFIMAPVFKDVQKTAIEPYMAKQIDSKTCIDRALIPLRGFMLRNTRPNDLALFVEMSREPRPSNAAACPSYVLIPAFCLSELKTAFEIGFLIYIPFLVIDVVVASVTMSMGMMMLPPVIISMPFKLLLFVMVDGWHLVLSGLARSFG